MILKCINCGSEIDIIYTIHDSNMFKCCVCGEVMAEIVPRNVAQPNACAQLSDVPVNEEVFCPFCNEKGFDLIGLKSHLSNGDCELYNQTENIVRI